MQLADCREEHGGRSSSSSWGWGDAKIDPTAASDFVLFAHLIPCCQHFVADSEPKVDFEAAMQARSTTRYGPHEPFLAYLLNHPVNRGIGQTLASKDLAAIGQANASWELVICLMRNILCHEYCFGWSSVREMMRVSLAYFGGRHEVERLLQLYATLVLLPPPSPPPSPRAPLTPSSSPSQSTSPCPSDEALESALHLGHLVEDDLWRDLLLFAQLIPCRSNNAIVDIQFEEEMSAMAEERKFGDWEMFAEYLKTHPANPQQWITPSHDISWMMVIRLMRNILCHERSMRFDGLRQFAHKTLDYFREREHFHDFMALYQAHCCGRPLLLTEEDDAEDGAAEPRSNVLCSHALRLFPAAQIQTSLAHNFCVWERMRANIRVRRERGLFCGLRPLQAFVRKCFAAPTNVTAVLPQLPATIPPEGLLDRGRPRQREKHAALITGGRGSGRTSAALVMAHHITRLRGCEETNATEKQETGADDDQTDNGDRIVYIDCAEHVALRTGTPQRRLDALLRLLYREFVRHTTPSPQTESEEAEEATVAGLLEKIDTIQGREGEQAKAVVILDDFHLMILEDTEQRATDQAEMILRLHEMIADLSTTASYGDRRQHGVFFILTSTPYLALYLYYFAAEEAGRQEHERSVERPDGDKRKALDHASTEDAREAKRKRVEATDSVGGDKDTRVAVSKARVRVRNCLKALHVYDIPGEATSEGELKATELLLRHYLPALHKHHLKAILHHISVAQIPLHAALLTSSAVAWCLADQRERVQQGEQSTVFTVALADPTRPVVHDRLERTLSAVHDDVVSLIPTAPAGGGCGDRFVALLHAYAAEGTDERPKGALWASLLAKGVDGRWRLKDVYLTTLLHFYLDRGADLSWNLKPITQGRHRTTSTARIDPPPLPPVVLLTHVAQLWRTTKG